MRKPSGKLGGAIVGLFLRAAMLFLLISPAFCHAQIDCPEVGGVFLCMNWQPTITSISPTTWIADNQRPSPSRGASWMSG
jgi:hypothetical protein